MCMNYHRKHQKQIRKCRGKTESARTGSAELTFIWLIWPELH